MTHNNYGTWNYTEENFARSHQDE